MNKIVKFAFSVVFVATVTMLLYNLLFVGGISRNESDADKVSVLNYMLARMESPIAQYYYTFGYYTNEQLRDNILNSEDSIMTVTVTKDTSGRWVVN